MNQKRYKVLLIIGTIFIITLLLLTIYSIKDKRTDDDITSVASIDKYRLPVKVEGINNIQQEISCGYACIEMIGDWLGIPVTEESLYSDNNNKITTALGKGFVKEMNKQFTDYKTNRYTRLKNTIMLEKIYTSLEKGLPVVVELAAKNKLVDDKWTLHFCIVTGIDVHKNEIAVSNPYGYEEVYDIEEFINATRYNSYENMEFYFTLGFKIGIFNKNTIYIIEAK